VTTAAAVAPSGAGDLANEQQSYQAAFDLLRELRYDQAVTAFQGFIKSYPNGRYAHIAQYWIGEANYAQRNFKEAIKDYQKLIDKYPNSPKLAEAMLKIGYSQYELKEMKQAEATLNQLIKSYPGTTEAGQAQNLIQKIRLKR
jgi:tol-pal system protein YbgF